MAVPLTLASQVRERPSQICRHAGRWTATWQQKRRWKGGRSSRPQKTGQKLGGGFKYLLFSPRMFGEDEPILTSIFFRWFVSNIFCFHPYLGKISNLTNIFQRGWNHQPVLFVWGRAYFLPWNSSQWKTVTTIWGIIFCHYFQAQKQQANLRKGRYPTLFPRIWSRN